MNGAPTDIEAILEDELTPEQRAAAVDDGTDVPKIACAGSGKSRTLPYRIAWLISQGADAESIVAFTFTKSAADSIQQRVATALGRIGRPPTEVGKVRIGTVHSFCEQLLVQTDARNRQFDVLDQNGLHLSLMSLYPQLGIHVLQGRPVGYFKRIQALATAWTTVHDEVLDLDEIVVHDPELGEILQRLRYQLNRSNYIDFSLMIRLNRGPSREGPPRHFSTVRGTSPRVRRG